LSFYGAGGDSLGPYGHSKDHRADLKQMILAVVIDGERRPICTEMLPGNTADVTVLLPIASNAPGARPSSSSRKSRSVQRATSCAAMRPKRNASAMSGR
jgi:hypothetical protein